MSKVSEKPLKGRGTHSHVSSRYLAWQYLPVDDGWNGDESLPALATTVQADTARTVIAWNDSPDLPFDRSLNPYRGCEHGCVYCYARPTHAYLGLSPGLDFETRLFAKHDAARLLDAALRKPGYRPAPLALGMNTDAYQPIERRLGITRGVLQVLHDFRHPLSIVTKSALIERDLDLLAAMAALRLANVFFSITTLDRALARRLEPRAAAPARRLQALRALHAAGIPVGVIVAPVIPGLNDHELETILAASRDAGATSAAYGMLRLPHELKSLFPDWLAQHAPLKARHVMTLVRDMRGGQDNSARFGERMRGTGAYADVIAQRFRLASRRLQLNQSRLDLDSAQFRIPPAPGDQMTLFE